MEISGVSTKIIRENILLNMIYLNVITLNQVVEVFHSVTSVVKKIKRLLLKMTLISGVLKTENGVVQ